MSTVDENGNLLDAKSIFDEDMTNGNEFEFTDFINRYKAYDKKNYNTKHYEAYKNTDSTFRKLLRKILGDDREITTKNIYRTISFDQALIVSKGLSEKTSKRVLDPITGEIITEKLTGADEINIKESFIKETEHIFENRKDAVKVLNMIVGQWKVKSGLEGTSLHKMGLFDAISKIELSNGEVMTPDQLDNLVKVYKATGDLAHERMVHWGSNAFSLFEIFGDKPMSTINQIYGGDSKIGKIRAGKLFGSLNLSQQTSIREFGKFMKMSVGKELGLVTIRPKSFVDHALDWIGNVSTIGSGILDIVPEFAWQFAKTVVRFPMTNKVNVLFKNSKSYIDGIKILHEMKKDPKAHPYIAKYLGGQEASALYKIKNSIDDVNGRNGRQYLNSKEGGTKDVKTAIKNLAGTTKLTVAKWNAIKWQDNVADISSMLFTNAYIDDAFKLGFDEIMSNPKYVNMATTLDMHGVTKEMFEKMALREPSKLGIREYDLNDFNEMELDLVERFMGDMYKQTSFTKSNKQLSNSIQDIADPRLRSFVRLLTFFKTTMLNKSFDLFNTAVKTNGYGGLANNFNTSNWTHIANLGLGLATVGGAITAMDLPETLFYGYDVDKNQNPAEQLMNEFGLYVYTQPSTLQRNLGKISSMKNPESVATGISNLAVGKVPTRIGKSAIKKMID